MTNLTKVPMTRLSMLSVVALFTACGAPTGTDTLSPPTPVQVAPAVYDAMGSAKLMFNRDDDATHTLSLNLLDGAARNGKVVSADAKVRGARLSPDGRRLVYSFFFIDAAFTVHHDLAVRDVASGVETIITNDTPMQGMPTWAPNGQDVIYPSNESNLSRFDYWQAPASAGGSSARRNLTRLVVPSVEQVNCPLGEYAVPAELSVRDELAFRCEGRVYIQPAGSTITVLFPIAGLTGDVQSIAWSPDGMRLAYTQFVGTELVLKTVARSGSAGTTLTSVSSAASNRAVFNRESLCWTADGQRLFFNAPEGNASSHIWVVRSDGTGLRQITSEPGAFDYNVSCT